MSLATCVKFGTTAGLLCGLTTAAYFSGGAKRAKAVDHPATFGLEMASVSSVLAGPFVGAAAGGGGYLLKKSVQRLRVAPQTTRVAALALITSSFAIAGAYHRGRTGK